ncbi:MAG: GTA-gp10 family protein, partial [Paracoccus sp. (in: a-proteobacteria)]
PPVAGLPVGALAVLVADGGASWLGGVVARIDEGAFGSRDILLVIVAGLRGGGWRGSAENLVSVQIDGGPLEAARVAAQLLALAFRVPA